MKYFVWLVVLWVLGIIGLGLFCTFAEICK